MWQLSYRPEVEDDGVAAVAWYDDKRHGLGEEFLSEYLAAIHGFLAAAPLPQTLFS